MFEWIFRKKQPYKNNEILNIGLNMSLAFGKNWLKPIQERLTKIFPELTPEELDSYNDICIKARDYGHNILYSVADTDGFNMKQSEFNSLYLNKYPWVTKKNLKHLYNQGMYYVYKDFGDLPTPNK